MKNSEFLRLIEEIGVFLDLRMTTIVQVIQFYKLFNESETHSYKQEIVVGACFFLATKLNEQLRKLRDIVNGIFAVIYFYKKANEQNQRTKKIIENEEKKECDDDDESDDRYKYLSLEFLTEIANENILKEFIPDFPFEKYTFMREEILKAEQHLLRILNYDLTNPYVDDYKLLLNYLNFIDDSRINHIAFGIYNDSFFAVFNERFERKEKIIGSMFLAQQFVDKNQKLPYNSRKEYYEKHFQTSYEKLCLFGKNMIEYYNLL